MSRAFFEIVPTKNRRYREILIMKNYIEIFEAKEHNLQSISLKIPRDQLVVITGVSGSGKSSLAFDTIFQEGQRRFIQSLSPYARQFLGQNAKADVDKITGLSPTICIDQKTVNRNPRSTVGTITEISTNLRLLMARLGTPHCPECQTPLIHQSLQKIATSMMEIYQGTKIMILAPIVVGRKGEYRKELAKAQRDGFVRVRVDGTIYRTEEAIHLQLSRYEKHNIDLVVDRLSIPKNNGTLETEHHKKVASRLLESLELALQHTEHLFAILCHSAQDSDNTTVNELETYKLYSTELTCVTHGHSAPEMEPRLFSFNAPQGMCLECNGIGYHEDFLWENLIDKNAMVQHAFVPLVEHQKIPFTLLTQELWEEIISKLGLTGREIWKSLSTDIQNKLCMGGNIAFTSYKETPRGLRTREHIWRGCFEALQYSWEIARPQKLQSYREQRVCVSCQGMRLNPLALHVLFQGKNIHDFQNISIEKALQYFTKITLSKQHEQIGRPILKELIGKLEFLSQVGLGYLSLSRTSRSLSGGEAQRIRLAAQVGSGLQGITYILDEPSIGLHPIDQARLLDSLEKLRDNGNSILVIEHDPITMHRADHLVEIGPRAGVLGGQVVTSGSYKMFMKSKAMTAQYLRQERQISIPPKRTCDLKTMPVISIIQATANNLKHVDLHIPLGKMVVITGVSGSGKSTLISHTLSKGIQRELYGYQGDVGEYKEILGLEHIDKMIEIDQSPIGRSPRSNPATYTGLLDPIRTLLSETLESRRRGYSKSRFSFNVDPQKGGGRCENCDGGGYNVVEMQFLPDVHVTCETCSGKRFTQETLTIRFNGKNIYEILDMDVDTALDFFQHHKKIKRILQTLQDVGLGYISLGQPSTTLSGGEAQRIKLATELHRVSTGRTLYILDEPTTGLHMEDVNRLLQILHKLVDLGNTVLIIEHDVDVIRSADHIVDLGPEGGENGGYIINVGTPEEISKQPSSTGQILGEIIRQSNTANTLEQSAICSLLQKRSSRKNSSYSKNKDIRITGATLHNLKNINACFPSGKMTVITGPSGSGKTTLAFDTLFSEGQRRYIESLSTYARRFLGRLKKPPVENIDGLAPAICIDQSNRGKTPRSTVATSTEIHDYLRLIFAHLGEIHCPECQKKLKAYSPSAAMESLQKIEERGWLLAQIQGEIIAGELTQNGYTKIGVEMDDSFVEKKLEDIEEILQDPFVIIDRFTPSKMSQRRVIQSIEQAYSIGNDRCCFLEKMTNKKHNFSREATCFEHGNPFSEAPTPRHFSFNTQIGACEKCNGLGTSQNISWRALFPEPNLSFWAAIHGWVKVSFSRSHRFQKLLEEVFCRHKISIKEIVSNYPKSFCDILLYGDKQKYKLSYQVKRSLFEEEDIEWEGLVSLINKWNNDAQWLREEGICHECKGERLKKPQRFVWIEGKNIEQHNQKSVDSAYLFWKQIQLSDNQMKILESPREELLRRLQFLQDVGLGYLTLNRPTKTLSGGESQRIRLASQLGSGLTRSIYVLDEPTIGLHPSDTERLIQTLHDIRSKGNTIVVVEHDEDIIKSSDYIIDIGPKAGRFGGSVVTQGNISKIDKLKSLTVDYLTGKVEIPIPQNYRKGELHERLSIRDATTNNLQHVDTDIPLGVLCVVCGVSGSGKSSLVFGDIQMKLDAEIRFREQIRAKNKKQKTNAMFPQKYLCVDQSPIGRSPRSTPASYCDIMDPIREIFSQTKLSRRRGYTKGRFSFNNADGRCEYCEGRGSILIEMHFLSDVWLECESCLGARYNQSTLEIEFQGKNIAQVLDMSVDEAADFFQHQAKIYRKLSALQELGLGYIQLGQPGNQFSGGEAQRIKLAKELAKGSRNQNCCFLLDEPTTGLHFDDVHKLLQAFHRLVDSGHSIIVIEHNLDIIKNADYVIELGPNGGVNGGQIIFSGNPTELQNKDTSTGKILTKYLSSKMKK